MLKINLVFSLLGHNIVFGFGVGIEPVGDGPELEHVEKSSILGFQVNDVEDD